MNTVIKFLESKYMLLYAACISFLAAASAAFMTSDYILPEGRMAATIFMMLFSVAFIICYYTFNESQSKTITQDEIVSKFEKHFSKSIAEIAKHALELENEALSNNHVKIISIESIEFYKDGDFLYMRIPLTRTWTDEDGRTWFNGFGGHTIKIIA